MTKKSAPAEPATDPQPGLLAAARGGEEPEALEAADLEGEPEPEDIRVLGWEPIDPAIAGRSPGLIRAMARTMADLGKVEWNARNQQGGYQYASIDAFLAAIRPAMAKHGLVLIQQLDRSEVGSYSTKGGENAILRILWRFYLCHEGGGVMGPIMLEAAAPANMGPQAYGGCQAYALKFCLRSLFLVATGEAEHDVDQTKGTRLPPRQQERATPPPQQRPAPQGPPERIPQWTRGGADGVAAKSAQAGPQREGELFGAETEDPLHRTAVVKLRARLNLNEIAHERVAKAHRVEKLEDLTMDQIASAHRYLDTIGAKSVPGAGA